MIEGGRPAARFVGRVESPLKDRAAAPRQADETAPEAWLVFDDDVAAGLEGLAPGDDLFLLTCLHLADERAVRVHPRGDPTRPSRGVFSTRSPRRPNPIGLHRVTIRTIEGPRVLVHPLEAVDGTPILDIKPVMRREGNLR
ncbi:MAG: tRNA (N6-threonylcarbamoyladenosine(37)-N6)-methyltransferase TrmO [Gemmatimonadota bacterium]